MTRTSPRNRQAGGGVILLVSINAATSAGHGGSASAASLRGRYTTGRIVPSASIRWLLHGLAQDRAFR